jgi:diguanylate cyclase
MASDVPHELMGGEPFARASPPHRGLRPRRDAPRLADDDARRLAVTSAAMRVLLGVAGSLVLPFAYPSLVSLRIVLALYVVIGAATLLIVRDGVGGSARAVASGVIDLTLLTWMVHAIGSTHTVLLSIYVYAAVLNVLVAGPAVGRLMAAVGSILYGLVLLAEQLGWLSSGGASRVEAAVSWGLVSTLTIVATGVVGRVMRRIRVHEGRLREANRELAAANAALEAANHKLELLSQRDPLTDLFNRRHLVDRLEQELRHVRRGRDVTFLMIDLDGFKRVNDLHGHAVGDSMLRQVAEAMRETMRETDVVGRWGGDELGVLLPDTALEEAEIAAQRLVDRLRSMGRAFAANAPVTASVGIAVASAKDDAPSLVSRADEATYRAKRGGGDRYCIG